MDDKGSTLIVVFGLPPMAHQDDPVRAIATAATLKHELGLLNCKCNIGIGTGIFNLINFCKVTSLLE
jgi:adenylate cyclase 10